MSEILWTDSEWFVILTHLIVGLVCFGLGYMVRGWIIGAALEEEAARPRTGVVVDNTDSTVACTCPPARTCPVHHNPFRQDHGGRA